MKKRWLLPAAAAALAAAPFAAELAYRGLLTAERPAAGRFELYAIGGSSTVGEPYGGALSFPSLAADALGGEAAGRPIEVVNLARPGFSLYPEAVALAARLSVRRRDNPAAVLIYAGHNERFTGPRERGPLERAREAARERLLYRSHLAGALFTGVERRFNLRGQRLIADYERHLRAAIQASLHAGAVPVLATLVSNETGVEPTVECLGAEQKAAALVAVKEGRPGEVPCLAPLADFRRAEAAARAGDYDAARRLYRRAVDEDPGNGFGRTTTEQNDLIRGLAAEYRVPLVDAARLFEKASPHGLIGNSLMSDGHHPNADGYALLARAFAQALSARFQTAIVRPLSDGEDAFARAKYGPDERENALAYSGRWLLTVSVGHPDPRRRMELAREAWEEAAALEPSDPRAALGLSLAREGALSPELLSDPRLPPLIEALGGKAGSPEAAAAAERAAPVLDEYARRRATAKTR